MIGHWKPDTAFRALVRDRAKATKLGPKVELVVGDRSRKSETGIRQRG